MATVRRHSEKTGLLSRAVAKNDSDHVCGRIGILASHSIRAVLDMARGPHLVQQGSK